MTKISHHPESEPRAITPLDRKSSSFSGIIFTLFLVGSIATTSYALLNKDLNLAPTEVTWPTFLNGDASSHIAKSLADAPLPAMAAKFERGLSWLVTGDLGARVRVGVKDWLFLNDELAVNSNRTDNAESRANEIVGIKHQLDQRGIKLIVVLIPDKSRIEIEYLGAQHRSKMLASRLNDWEDRLTNEGIDVVNLTATLTNTKRDGLTPFLRTDTHWSEQGAEASAKTVAKKIQVLQVTPSPAQSTRIDRQSMAIRPGDLVKLAGIDWLPQGLQPLAELAQHSSFKSGPIKSKLQAKGLDDLFGDDNLPNIVLIGTSFSRQSQFIPYLEMQLNSKIGNFALDGGDFSGSAKAYFGSPSFIDTPPKILIWEIPERVIEMDRKRDAKIW